MRTRKLRTLIFIFAVNLLGSYALATGGSEAGNGGSSIVCQDPSGRITSVELLDFYEGRTQRNINVDLGPSSNSVETKMGLVVQRLSQLDSNLAKDIQEEARFFQSQARYYSGVRLVEIPDSQNLFIPSGCQQEQIAIWRNPNVPEDQLFNINKDLWDHLDNDNKVGLMLHEILYSKANTSNSKMVRYLVSKITSADIANLRFQDYVEVLREMGYSSVAYHGIEFTIDKDYPVFNVDGSFKGGPILYNENLVTIQGQSIAPTALMYDKDGNIVSIQTGVALIFQVDGQDVWFQQNTPIKLSGDAVIGGYTPHGSKNNFKRAGYYNLKVKARDNSPILLLFEKDGTLRLCKSCEGTVTIYGRTFSVGLPRAARPDDEGVNPASFYNENGDWYSLTLAHPTSIEVGNQDFLLEGELVGSLHNRTIYGGNVAQATVAKIGDQTVKIAKGKVSFYDSGEITMATLAEDVVLPSFNGKKVLYLSGMELSFTIDGVVCSAQASNLIKLKLLERKKAKFDPSLKRR